jgi:hypothetical protein
MSKNLSEKDYKNLYLKYKVKYNKFKNMKGGVVSKWEIINDRGELEPMDEFESVKIDSLREINLKDDESKYDLIDLICIDLKAEKELGHKEYNMKLLFDRKQWQFNIPNVSNSGWEDFTFDTNTKINEASIIDYKGRKYYFYSGKLNIPPEILEIPGVIKLKKTDLK